MDRKVKVMLKIFPLVMTPLMLLVIGLVICSQPEGFSLHKISSSLGYNERWEVEGIDLEMEQTQLQKIFSQPFHYWGSNPHWYGFISEDQKFLLKFFNMDRLLPKTGLQGWIFSLFESYRFHQVDKKREILDQIFGSVKAAYEEFKGQTSLFYIHLNKTRRLRKKVELIDQTGHHLFVDLDSKEFILDAKADLLYPSLITLYEKGEEAEVRNVMHALFSLIMSRCKKGYGEFDHQVGDHYGLIKGRLVLFDEDVLIPEESLALPFNYEREVERAALAMSSWMKIHCPAILPILEDELEQFFLSSVSNP